MKRGIDVSVYQNTILWADVHAAGIDWAMIKATQGKSEQNSSLRLFEDSRFRVNIVAAHDNDVACGTYHYLTAQSVQEAREEADYYLRAINSYRALISLWAAVDVESKYLPKDKKLLTAIVQAFCDRVAQAGYKPMVYTNPDFLKNRLNDISKYPLWLALWRNNDLVPTVQQYKNLYLWQWGAEKISGITGKVDANLMIREMEDNGVSAKKLDNTPEQWSKEAVEWAVKNKILVGNENGDLMLSQNVTREQMCVFLKRLYDVARNT